MPRRWEHPRPNGRCYFQPTGAETATSLLAASGAALAGTSLLLERWLRSGPDGERFGFTAAALYDEARRERLLPIAAALAAAPAGRTLPGEPPVFDGKGGGFGGGGASGAF